jgi:hypothetical protein
MRRKLLVLALLAATTLTASQAHAEPRCFITLCDGGVCITMEVECPS